MQTLHSFSGVEDTRLTLLRQEPKVDDLYELYYSEPETVSDSGGLDKLDKDGENPKIVVNKQQSMEELVLVLERALSMAKNPSAKAEEVISHIIEQLENIQNPHRALELELARLVEAKTPPNGECYKTRTDKKELAVAFFHRVYGRFYEAGVLYKHQLRAIDFSLYSLLAQMRDQLSIPTKKDANDKMLSKLPSHKEAFRVAKLVSRRRQVIA